MPNDYFEETRAPGPRERLRSEPLKAEFRAVEAGFDELPSKNQLAGAAQLLSEEASTSAANAYILTSSYPITALVKGISRRWFVTNTNTAAAVATVDGLGPKPLVALDGSALTGQEIVAGRFQEIVYDGEKWFLVQSAKALTTVFVLDAALLPLNFAVNSAISATTLPTVSGGASPYTYAATGLPTGLMFNASNRQLSGTPTTLGSSVVTYRVTDANGNTVSFTFRINIVPVVLTLADPADRTLELNTNYEFELPEAAGGTGERTYSVSGLPEGLVFDPARREISGSPEEHGSFSITYTVSDSGTPRQTAEASFTISVRAASALELPVVNTRNLVPNQAVSNFTLPEATGGLQPYTYIVTGLPNGLKFNASTREVTGTPTQSGNFFVTYRVVDDDATRYERRFLVTVDLPGRRYITVLSAVDAASVSTAELTGGNDYSPSWQRLTLPTWTGVRRIVIAQPASQATLTRISLSGLGNALSDFTKLSRTTTVGGIAYAVWVSNEDQGDAISGEVIEVRP